MRAALYSTAATGRTSVSVAGGGPASALPTAVGGEHVAQRGQALVVGGALLVIDHQQPLRTRSEGLGHVADSLAHGLRARPVPGVRPLGLVGEDSGGAAAS